MKFLFSLLVLLSSQAFAGRGSSTDCALSKITQRATTVAQAMSDGYYGNKEFKVVRSQMDTRTIYNGNQKVYDYVFEAGELFVTVEAVSYRSQPGTQCYISRSQVSVRAF